MDQVLRLLDFSRSYFMEVFTGVEWAMGGLLLNFYAVLPANITNEIHNLAIARSSSSRAVPALSGDIYI